MTNPDLVDNLLLTFKEPYEKLSNSIKELVLKEKIAGYMKEIIEHLNDLIPDVHFSTEWIAGAAGDIVDSEGRLYMHGFDRHTQSDGYNYSEDEEETEDVLNDTPLDDIFLKLNYVWVQQCNLGHTHRTHRFYCYSMARVLEMLAYYETRAYYCKVYEWKEGFFKMYVPNFFY